VDSLVGNHARAQCLLVRVFVRAEGVDERLREISLDPDVEAHLL
jgi:hypothetical protein